MSTDTPPRYKQTQINSYNLLILTGDVGISPVISVGRITTHNYITFNDSLLVNGTNVPSDLCKTS